MFRIDYVQALDVDEQDAVNEIGTLTCLASGLAVLAHQVAVLEAPIQAYEQAHRKRVRFTGFDVELPDGTILPSGSEQLLPCYFHWFGTSVCNLARLVGFLSGVASGAYERKATEDREQWQVIARHCGTYVDSIPELTTIKLWRNKVFAHFAITDPRKNDNPGLLDVSAMSPVTYIDGRFRVGGMFHHIRGADVDMPQWSVTEAFEQLAPRFWPSHGAS